MLFIEKLNVEHPLKISYTNMTKQINVNKPKYVPHPKKAVNSISFTVHFYTLCTLNTMQVLQ